MSKLILAEALRQDIKDLEGILAYEEYGLDKEKAKILARGILINLSDNIEEFLNQ